MTLKIINKKAGFNYQISEVYEAGIVLTGDEVKAIKKGKINLSHGYAKIIDNEMFLVGAVIDSDNSQPSPKLLLHRKEIESINSKVKAKNLTLVPVKLYTKGRNIKLEVGLAKSKKIYQKKDIRKIRDIKRDVEREVRGKL